jgi:hypothetical protein
MGPLGTNSCRGTVSMKLPVPNRSMRHRDSKSKIDDTGHFLQGASWTIASRAGPRAAGGAGRGLYRPLLAAITPASYAMRWMARELDFEWIQLIAFDACFMRPSERQYPHHPRGPHARLHPRTWGTSFRGARGIDVAQVKSGRLARAPRSSHSPNILLLLVAPRKEEENTTTMCVPLRKITTSA